MMKGFCGELGAVIKSVSISPPCDGTHDLTFKTEDGAFLHIIGDNNIVELLENALEEYRENEHKRAVEESLKIVDGEFKYQF